MKWTTLILHRQADAVVTAALGRKMAADIPGAKYIEYPNGDHAFWAGDVEALLGDIEEFVTGHRESSSSDLERVLATVLFTDIVDSTRSAADMGDQRWRALLDSHDHLARQIVDKHRGSFVKSTGDGILARFDGPGRAVRCALAFTTAAQQIGLPLRAGLHTGEIELRGEDIGGICRSCCCQGDGAFRLERGPGIASGHRPCRRSGLEILATWIARTQGASRPLGFVRRKLVKPVEVSS